MLRLTKQANQMKHTLGSGGLAAGLAETRGTHHLWNINITQERDLGL